MLETGIVAIQAAVSSPAIGVDYVQRLAERAPEWVLVLVIVRWMLSTYTTQFTQMRDDLKLEMAGFRSIITVQSKVLLSLQSTISEHGLLIAMLRGNGNEVTQDDRIRAIQATQANFDERIEEISRSLTPDGIRI